jgi:hypothetical protein
MLPDSGSSAVVLEQPSQPLLADHFARRPGNRFGRPGASRRDVAQGLVGPLLVGSLSLRIRFSALRYSTMRAGYVSVARASSKNRGCGRRVMAVVQSAAARTSRRTRFLYPAWGPPRESESSAAPRPKAPGTARAGQVPKNRRGRGGDQAGNTAEGNTAGGRDDIKRVARRPFWGSLLRAGC